MRLVYPSQMKCLTLGSLLVLVASYPVYAQLPVDFGFKGGISVTKSYANDEPAVSYYSHDVDEILGAAIEVRLVKDISVEADGLYRLVNLEYLPQSLGIFVAGHYPTWEFPVLAKCRLRTHLPLLRPLVEAGPSFRAHGKSTPSLTADGITVGGGIECKLPVIRVSGELRYTRWQGPGSGAPAVPNVNQAELLLGIMF